MVECELSSKRRGKGGEVYGIDEVPNNKASRLDCEEIGKTYKAVPASDLNGNITQPGVIVQLYQITNTISTPIRPVTQDSFAHGRTRAEAISPKTLPCQQPSSWEDCIHMEATRFDER